MRLGVVGVGVAVAVVLASCGSKHAATPHVQHVAGIVVDDQGRPVPGAHVGIVGDDLRKGTAAGPDGTFELAVEGGQYLLGAYTDALVSEPTMIAVSDRSNRIVVRVHRAAAVSFRVVDADDGTPIADATVTAPFGQTGRTGADGRVTISGLGSRADIISAHARGYAAVEPLLNIDGEADPNAERVIKLPRGARVTGTVLDPDSKLVPDATVYLSRMGSVSARPITVKSDGHGAWSSAPLARGRYGVTGESQQYGRTAAIVIDVDGVHERTDVHVRVAPGTELVATVVGIDGRSVSRADVEIVSNDSAWTETTDERGKLDLRTLPPGGFHVWARAGTRASSRGVVDLVTGKRADVRLVVDESSIAGTVTSSKGVPVVGVTVFARPKTFMRDAGRYDMTDAQGRFDIRGVPPGEYELTTSQGLAMGPRFGGVVARTGDRAVRFALPGNASIRGRVLLDHVPVEAFGIVVAVRDEVAWRQTFATTITRSPDGRFAKPEVEVGQRLVIVFGPGFARKLIPVELREGNDLDLGDIVVDHGQRVTGRVTDATGAPVVGATVEEFQAAPVRFVNNDATRRVFLGGSMATTDANGAYVIENIPPPTWTVPGRASPFPNRISARHPDRGLTPLRDLAATATTADFVLKPSGGIDGRVSGPQSDQTYVHAMLASGEGEPASARVEADRSFHFEHLVEGEYDVSLTRQNSDGFSLPAARVKVEGKTRANVSFALAPTAPLRIRVVDGTCGIAMLLKRGASPPKNLYQGGSLGFAFCDGGNAEVANVPPGSYRVCIDETHCADAIIAATPAPTTIEIRSKP
jgi:protocatechuate 3,4-dioxygenase beta subunit